MSDGTVSKNVSGAKLDVSLVNVDVARVLLDLTGSPIGTVAREILTWLGREKLNQSDYQYCMERTAGLAYPNDQGLKLRECLSQNNVRPVILRNLALVQSGAIGRWLALSDEHSYLVTTTVIACRFYSLEYIPELLYEIIQATGGTKDKKSNPPESIVKMRLLRVLTKVVESISLNVVNVGYTASDFPVELRSQCQGHLVNATLFARIVSQLQKPDHELILLCDRFPADILLWAINHFHGTIEISIESKTIYKKLDLGGPNSLVVLVNNACSLDSNQNIEDVRNHYERSEVDLFERVENSSGKSSFIDKLGWNRLTKAFTGQQNMTRQELYTSRYFPLSIAQDLLSREDMERCDWLSQRFMAWLVQLPIDTPQNPDYLFQLEFEINVMSSSSASASKPLRFGHLFARSPMFLNCKIDYKRHGQPEFTFVPPEEQYSEDAPSKAAGERGIYGSICKHFPAIAHFMNDMRERCCCVACARDDSWLVNWGFREEGCLRFMVIANILLKIGHAIADGFGIPDASGMVQIKDYCDMIATVILHLCLGRADWAEWCKVALATALGITDLFRLDQRPDPDRGSNFLIGAQHGSMIALAKWLNLEQRPSLSGMFSLELAEGRVGGIEDESTIIDTYEVAAQRSQGGTENFWKELNDSIWEANEDEPPVTVQHGVLAARRSYRLLTIVSTASCKRVLNPGTALINLFRSTKEPDPCNHTIEDISHNSLENKNLHKAEFKVCDFEDILECWDRVKDSDEEICQFSQVLHSESKINIALCTVIGSMCMIIEGRPNICWRCFVNERKLHVPEDTALKVVVVGDPHIRALSRRT